MKSATTIAIALCLAARIQAQVQPLVPPGIGFGGVLSLANVGVLPPPSAIEFSSDGSTLYVGAAGNQQGSLIQALPVLRAPSTNAILGFGPATYHSAAPYIDAGLEFGPGGVLFFAEYPTNVLGEVVGGVVHEFPLPAAIGTSGGLTFIPSGLPNAGTLLVSSFTNSNIYSIGLTPNPNGTYTPTTATLYATMPVNLLEAIRFVPDGPYAGDLLVADFNSPDGHISRIDIDPTTGLPIGGASTPAVYDVITNTPYLDGMAFDPVTKELFVTDWLVFGLFRFEGFSTLQTLTISKPTLSAGGDSAFFSMRAGSVWSGLNYVLAASASGTLPGTTIGSVTVPLNVDAVTLATLDLADGPFLPNSYSYFSQTGESLAGVIVPPGVIPGSAIGVTVHWAYVVLDYPPAATFASNAVSLTIVP
jgi:hypothetical protein